MPASEKKSFLQTWLNLPPRTRMMFSLGVCLVGVTGIAISDYLEKQIPPSNVPLNGSNDKP
ncbi:hypothetical protein BDQ17DRAFT_62399 [Cyathus striatus]|nr:hypothetical protein BDQ17DRAFT_62399 [Cyathus striatus]